MQKHVLDCLGQLAAWASDLVLSVQRKEPCGVCSCKGVAGDHAVQRAVGFSWELDFLCPGVARARCGSRGVVSCFFPGLGWWGREEGGVGSPIWGAR